MVKKEKAEGKKKMNIECPMINGGNFGMREG
jgi:hypothetical protein